jgi:hypothetical protein
VTEDENEGVVILRLPSALVERAGVVVGGGGGDGGGAEIVVAPAQTLIRTKDLNLRRRLTDLIARQFYVSSSSSSSSSSSTADIPSKPSPH